MALLTADEIVEIATQLEESGEAFYNAAAEGATTPSVKALFEELAIQEQYHRQAFEQMGGSSVELALSDDQWDEFQAYTGALLQNSFFAKPYRLVSTLYFVVIALTIRWFWFPLQTLATRWHWQGWASLWNECTEMSMKPLDSFDRLFEVTRITRQRGTVSIDWVGCEMIRYDPSCWFHPRYSRRSLSSMSDRGVMPSLPH